MPATVQRALLVVDMQNDVAADAATREGVVLTVATLVQSARQAGAHVIWVQHDDEDLPRGTFAWQILDQLDPHPDDVRVEKQHRSAFAGTGLADLLRSRGVTDLVIVGTQSAFCVDMAGKHALAEGFNVTLVSDGHCNGTMMTTDGPVSDAIVRAMTNQTWSSLRHPGLTVEVKPAEAIAWGP